MAQVTLPNTLQNDTTADAEEVMANFNAIVDQVNGSLDANNLANGAVTTAVLGADAVTGANIGDDEVDSEHYAADSVDDEHINWGTGAGQVSAGDMPIADAGGIITATDVEDALQEIMGDLDTHEADTANPHTVTLVQANTAGGDLDDIGDGTTYKKVAGVSAGNQTQTASYADDSVTDDKLHADCAGAGLTQDGNGALQVNADDSTLEVATDTLQVKAGGVDTAQLADGAAGASKLGTGATFDGTVTGYASKLARIGAIETTGLVPELWNSEYWSVQCSDTYEHKIMFQSGADLPVGCTVTHVDVYGRTTGGVSDDDLDIDVDISTNGGGSYTNKLNKGNWDIGESFGWDSSAVTSFEVSNATIIRVWLHGNQANDQGAAVRVVRLKYTLDRFAY